MAISQCERDPINQLERQHLATREEAINTIRRIGQKDSPDGTDNGADRERGLAQNEAALIAIQESVSIFRELAKKQAAKFLPDLAFCLLGMAKSQRRLAQKESALVSLQEAVEHFQKLANQRPDAFLPDLVRALKDLATTQQRLGQLPAALASAAEVVKHERKLAHSLPDIFLFDLAQSLELLSSLQHKAGHLQAARSSNQEAVEHCRELAKKHPPKFLPPLAAILNRSADLQEEAGQLEEAVASTQEAVRILRDSAIRSALDEYRPVASTQAPISILQRVYGSQQDEFIMLLHVLVGSLSRLAERQMQLNDVKAALESFSEIALHLQRTASLQSDKGQHEAALNSATGALAAIWSSFVVWPHVFADDTNAIIIDILDRLKGLGKPPTPDLIDKIATFERLTSGGSR